MPSFSSKIKINPILRKDIKVQARSMKISWSVFIYEMILALVFIMTLAIITSVSGNDYKSIVAIFPVLAITQLGILSIVIPILTAGSIAGEKERQTFDILLMTPLSPMRIVFGKISTAVVRTMVFIIGSVPIMSISFTYGGLSWGVLFLFLLLAVVYAIFLGSIGVFCSTISRKAILCVLLAFAFYAGIQMITSIPMLVVALSTTETVWETPVLEIFNPICIFIEFFVWAMSGEGLVGQMGTMQDKLDIMGPVSAFLLQPGVWMAFNIVGVLGFSFLMMRFSAMRINPLRASNGQNKKMAKRSVANQQMQQPVMQQPMMGQPMMGQPMMQQPMMGQPMIQQPVMGQPMMGQPMMGQPMMQQPMMGQPMMQQPMMNQQVPVQNNPYAGNTGVNISPNVPAAVPMDQFQSYGPRGEN